MGNHEDVLDKRIGRAERGIGNPEIWPMHPWFPQEVARSDWSRWRTAIATMPIAATIETKHGNVGLIHASPTARHWSETLRKLDAGDADTVNAALWSAARAHGMHMAAACEGVPIDVPIAGARAVLTGHAIVETPRTTANVWHIDTGAGSEKGSSRSRRSTSTR